MHYEEYRPHYQGTPRKYAEVAFVMDDFEKYMVDKQVEQDDPNSVKGHDKECGCCVAAHLARMFGEGDYFDIKVEKKEMNGPMACSYTHNVLDWARDYATWKHDNYDENDDYDGWDGLSWSKPGDRAKEWYEGAKDRLDFHYYSYGDGIMAISKMMNYSAIENGNFQNILANIVFGEWAMAYPFEGQDWAIDTQDIHWAIRVALLVNELYIEKKYASEYDIGSFSVMMQNGEGAVGREMAEKLEQSGVSLGEYEWVLREQRG